MSSLKGLMQVQKKGQQLRVPFSVMMTPLSCVSPPCNSTARNSLQCQKRVGSAETEHLSTVIQCSSLPRRLRNPLLHPPSPAPPPPPLSTLSWSIQRGNDGGLVTARSTPGLSRQSHPREAASNWADTFFAAVEANESQLALHPRGPAGLGFKKEFVGRERGERRFMEMMNSSSASFRAELSWR